MARDGAARSSREVPEGHRYGARRPNPVELDSSWVAEEVTGDDNSE